MNTEVKTCCICGKVFSGWGNNPWPVEESGTCCDDCNSMYVIPARLAKISVRRNNNENK